MPKWHRDSIFGPGPRRPMDREQRAQFKAKLRLQRRPGRLTVAAAHIGRILVDMLGGDGRLDPSHATIAARAAVHVDTVRRAVAQLRQFGFLDWTRRLVRTAWRCEQTSSAYVLKVPAAVFNATFILKRSKMAARAICGSQETSPAPDLLAARRAYWEGRVRPSRTE
jgi:hypothetical protein